MATPLEMSLTISKFRGLQLEKHLILISKKYSNWNSLSINNINNTNDIISSPKLLNISSNNNESDCPKTVTKRSKKLANNSNNTTFSPLPFILYSQEDNDYNDTYYNNSFSNQFTSPIINSITGLISPKSSSSSSPLDSFDIINIKGRNNCYLSPNTINIHENNSNFNSPINNTTSPSTSSSPLVSDIQLFQDIGDDINDDKTNSNVCSSSSSSSSSSEEEEWEEDQEDIVDDENDDIDENIGIINYNIKPRVRKIILSDDDDDDTLISTSNKNNSYTNSNKNIISKKSIIMNRIENKALIYKATKDNTNYFISITKREILTNKLYSKYNLEGFNNKLPVDLSIKWSKRLSTTAGITIMKLTKEGNKEVKIELSIKVVDNEDRLRNTLLHEMCHAAAFYIDGERKPAHGKCFWKWAKICELNIENAAITTCHSYDIHKPHQYCCSSKSCSAIYKTHNKKGIDLIKHRCGICKNKLVFTGSFKVDGTPIKSRECTGFSLFVKDNYEKISKEMINKLEKKSNNNNNITPLKAPEVMKELSKLYKNIKNQNDSSNNSIEHIVSNFSNINID